MRVFVVMAFVLAAACAAPGADREFATPTCTSDRECAAKWNAAEIWINRNIGRPVAERTDTVMRTEMSQSPGNYLSVRVEKEPLNGDGWKIVATMYCAKRVGCDPSAWEETRRFNRYVDKAWKVIEPPQPRGKPGSDRN